MVDLVAKRTLWVKIADACGVPGGKAVMLFGDDGEQLPNVVAVEYSIKSVDQIPTITVTFMVDGNKVRFE
jgi:hypothetical protein